MAQKAGSADVSSKSNADVQMAPVLRLMQAAAGLSQASRGKRLMLFTMGSRGDVQPFLALGCGLQRAGFALRVLTNVNHVAFMKDFGLDAVAANIDAEKWIKEDPVMLQCMAQGQMLKLARSLAEKNRQSFRGVLQAQLREVRDFRPDVLLTVGHEMTQACAIGHALNLPVVLCHLTAAMPTAMEPSMVGEPPWLPGWCHLLAWRIMTYLFLAGSKDGKHPALIEELPECEPYLIRNLEQQEIQMYGAGVLHLTGVSRAVVTPKPDWPCQPTLTGFWVVGCEEQERHMSTGNKSFGGTSREVLEGFLKRGEPPVYMGWGSMLAVSAEHMACLAVRSLKIAGNRGIVLGGWAGLSKQCLLGQPDSQELLAYVSESVLFVPTAPHEWLFPQCAAIVHHGGSGTTAAALRSGRPSVVTPCAFDQFANAQMVARLGAGLGLKQIRRVTAEELAAALIKATTNMQMVERAKSLGGQLSSEDGVGAAVRALDRFIAQEVATGAWEEKEHRAPSWLTRLGHCCAFLCGHRASMECHAVSAHPLPEAQGEAVQSA